MNETTQPTKRVRGRPFQKGAPGRPKGAKNKRTVALAAFNRQVLESPEYRRKFKKRLVDGTASASEVQIAYWYGYGKPSDKIDLRVRNEITADSLVDEMTTEEAAIMRNTLARLREAEEDS